MNTYSTLSRHRHTGQLIPCAGGDNCLALHHCFLPTDGLEVVVAQSTFDPHDTRYGYDGKWHDAPPREWDRED